MVDGWPQVRDRARDAVLGAIDELGSVPSRAARSLVTRRTDCIALVVSESEDRVFAEPFFAEVIRGASYVFAASDLQLVLIMSQSSDDRLRAEQFLVRGHVDGALLLSLHAEDPLPRNLLRHGLPVVTGGRPFHDDAGIPYVDVDNRSGGRLAVEHHGVSPDREVVPGDPRPQFLDEAHLGVGVAPALGGDDHRARPGVLPFDLAFPLDGDRDAALVGQVERQPVEPVVR